MLIARKIAISLGLAEIALLCVQIDDVSRLVYMPKHHNFRLNSLDLSSQ